MTPLAHLGGVPVEELLGALAGPAAGLALVRAWLLLRLRRRPEPDGAAAAAGVAQAEPRKPAE